MKGFAKIEQFCHHADSDLMWIDTCCIDKTSSAELSEAINSMYRWYKGAKTCIAYLDDVDGDDPYLLDSSFRRSRWFTRGWTLQELVAPENVIFYTRDWNKIGTRKSLVGLLHQITKIPHSVLSHDCHSADFSIAERMAWASTRQTTRVEDRAYSLMGLFGIFMPIIYGEGDAAFQRLQREIIQHSGDQSVFAPIPNRAEILHIDSIMSPTTDSNPKEQRLYFRPTTYFLAKSPAEFAHSVRTQNLSSLFPEQAEYIYTNYGIRIQLPLLFFKQSDSEYVVGILQCGINKEVLYGIVLQANAGIYHPQYAQQYPSEGRGDNVTFPSPFVFIPWINHLDWLRHAQTRTIIISLRPHDSTPLEHSALLKIRAPRKHDQLLIDRGIDTLAQLNQINFVLAGVETCRSTVQVGHGLDSLGYKFLRDGGLLLYYIIPSTGRDSVAQISQKQLQEDTPVTVLLFKNDLKAFSLWVYYSHSVSKQNSTSSHLSMRLRAHSSPIEIQALANQFNTRDSDIGVHSYVVQLERKGEDPEAFGSILQSDTITTHVVRASSLLDLISRYVEN